MELQRRIFTPSIVHRGGIVMVGAILVATMSLAGPAKAHADQAPESAGISQEAVSDLAEALTASDVSRSTSEHGTVEYTFADGTTLRYVQTPSSSRLGGGKENNGQFYIRFNQLDQDLLMAGMGIGLTVAICSVPIVGAIACGVAGAIVAVGMVFVSHFGKCKGNKQLYVHVKPSWSVCR